MTPEEKEHILREATVHFSRSGGKGGQNVNKVETKVDLVFNISHSAVFDEYTKGILLDALKNKLNHEGNLHVTSSTERYQHSNRKKAEEKLIKMLETALLPEKKRYKTKPTAQSKTARLFAKKKKGALKRERTRLNVHED